jgi:hypothetical protein
MPKFIHLQGRMKRPAPSDGWGSEDEVRQTSPRQEQAVAAPTPHCRVLLLISGSRQQKADRLCKL